MTAPIKIVDPKTGVVARVTQFGQLVTAPLNFSTPVNVKLDVINTVFTIINPQDGKNIIIDSLVITANKNVGVNDATVTLYSAVDDEDIAPGAAEILFEMKKNTNIVLTGLNFIIPEGRYFLAKTDDADIYITAGYYYAPID